MARSVTLNLPKQERFYLRHLPPFCGWIMGGLKWCRANQRFADSQSELCTPLHGGARRNPEVARVGRRSLVCVFLLSLRCLKGGNFAMPVHFVRSAHCCSHLSTGMLLST